MDYALKVADGDLPLLPLLDDELAQSSKHVDATVADTLTRLDNLRDELNELGLQGHRLTDDIESVAPVPLLEAKLDRLDHLNAVRNYLIIVRNILVLVDGVKDQESYQLLLIQIDTCIVELPSLREFLLYSQQKAFNNLKATYETKVIAALEDISYPYTQDPPHYSTLPKEARVKFELSFRALLKFLQEASSFHAKHPWITTSPSSPMSCLITPLQLRFKFHFDTDRPTNRLDKPEWYFTHILNVLHLHRAFITGPIQHLLSAVPNQQPALHEFTKALLPVPTRKFKKSIAAIIQPSDGSPPKIGLLAHTLQQALIFDAKIKEDAYLNDDEWNGIAWEVLGNRQWFDTWLKGETDFAQHQYNTFIHSPSAWIISSANNSTTSATSLLTLLTRTTEAVLAPLPPSHRMPFLANIHLSLLKAYQERIEGSLDAFDALSGILGVGASVVPGDVASGPSRGGGGEMTKGTEGTNKLLKALLSSRSVKDAVRDWGVDLVFLETQEYLIMHPPNHPFLPGSDEFARGTAELFDKVQAAYESLYRRSMGMIVDVVVREVGDALNAWFGEQWTHMSHDPPQMDEEMSPLLHPPLRTLDSHLRFLAHPAQSVALPAIMLSQISRSTVEKLSEVIITKSAILQSYTGRGRGKKASYKAANAWGRDVAGFAALAKSGVGEGVGAAGWKKLEEMAGVMELPTEEAAELVETLFGVKDESEWKKWRDKMELEVLDIDEVRRLVGCREEAARWI